MSAEKGSSTEELATITVYVQLLNEGTVAYRPVPAKHAGDDSYVLEGWGLEETGQEEWEFIPGTRVICEPRTIEDQMCLVAVCEA
jgi:hypothetical protein